MELEQLRFLTPEKIREIDAFEGLGTPCYVYDERTFNQNIDRALAFPNAFGITVRYAVKANPNSTLVKIAERRGCHFDASTGFEARRLIRKAGIPGHKIRLTAQQLPDDLEDLVRNHGIHVTACSLHQLETYGRLFPETKVAVRINPPGCEGGGGTKRTSVAGPGSSFGIWYRQMEKIVEIAEKHRLIIDMIHGHVGSGGEPDKWLTMVMWLIDNPLTTFSSATKLGVGGGYKIARMRDEEATDLNYIGNRVKERLERFYQETGRKIHIETEPGTSLIATAGAIVARITDIVSTKPEGYNFIKSNAGMPHNTRPALYGAQHPIIVVPNDDTERGVEEYVVAGPCCESGDIWTPAKGNPEGILPRLLKEARIGDYLVQEGTGAYCAAMCTKNYNSIPEAPEVLLRKDGSLTLIRRRQSEEQITENEVDVI